MRRSLQRHIPRKMFAPVYRAFFFSLIPIPSSLPRQRHSPRIAPRSVRRGASRRCVQGCLAVVVGVGVRGGWFVPFSSLARCEAWRVARPNLFGGGASRTTLATSLREATFGRSILPTREGCSPAPDGASCENHPRIRPYLVVAPSGAAFWVGVRVSQRLYNHQTRAEGLVRDKSQLGG